MPDENEMMSEPLLYSTTRIETYCNGIFTGSGTGFFYSFMFGFMPDPNSFLQSVITNKHVIKGSDMVRITIVEADENNKPIDNQHITYEIKIQPHFIVSFEDESVDLCVILIGNEITNRFNESGRNPYIRYFDKADIGSMEILSKLSSLEEILMIGYPNGLWDAMNNKPIFRRGITATHVKFNYNGKKEFLIDAACFPGSSGSPVLIFNEGSYTHQGRLLLANRLILLGILFSGPQNVITGEIRIINSPLLNRQISVSSIPNNLGFVIKAERIIELEQWFFQNVLKNQIQGVQQESHPTAEESPQ